MLRTRWHPKDILEFWFGLDEAHPLAQQERWWKKDADFDREVRTRFAAELAAADRGELTEWEETPKGRLALILIFDQFTRNMFRNRPESFAFDPRALALSRDGQEKAMDRKLAPVQRWFFYLPMMHAEDRDIQGRSVEAFRGLAETSPVELRQAMQGSYDYAVKHAEIIERFGRFPHRNAILGRESTPEELEFLKQPGSSF